MHRDGLFFDPLEAEEDAPAQASERGRRPTADELQAQRRRELARVQEELRKMAAGPPRRGG